MGDVVSIDPRTGETVEVVAQETTTAEVDRLAAAALAAAPGARGDGPGRPGRPAPRAGRRPRGPAGRRRRGRRPGDRPRPDPAERRAHPHRLPAAAVRRGPRGGQLPRGDDRPRRRDTPMGPRPDLRRMLRADRPGRRLRRQQLPARLLRARRRHRLGAGRRLAGDRQGARLAPGDVAAGLRRHGRGRPRRRRAGGDARHRARRAGRRRPGRPPGDPRRRLHRLGQRRQGAAGDHRAAARPDPVLRRAVAASTRVVVTPRAAARARARRSARELVGSFTLGAGQFCTKPGPRLRARPAPRATPSSTPWPRPCAAPRRRRCSTRASPASYGRISSSLADLPGVETVAAGQRDRRRRGSSATPLLLTDVRGRAAARGDRGVLRPGRRRRPVRRTRRRCSPRSTRCRRP